MKATLVLLSITLFLSVNSNNSRPSSQPASSCSWASWGAWGNCSQNCDGGYQRRYKECKCSGMNETQPDSCYTRYNRYQPYEDKECNKQACCTWTWGNWTECSAPCNGGSQSRSQVCSCQPRYNSTRSSKNGDDDSRYGCSGRALVQSQVCNNVSCCTWGNWSYWTTCEGQNACGSYNAKQYRYRDCSCVAGAPAKSSSSKNSKGDDDQDNSDGDTSNDNDNGRYYGKYKRHLQNKNKSYSKVPNPSPSPAPIPDECSVGDRQWEDQPCPSDDCCYWGEWTEVQPCTKNCGGGISVRTKGCMCPSSTDSNDNSTVTYEQVNATQCESIGPQPYKVENCNEQPCGCTVSVQCTEACPVDNTTAAQKTCTCPGLTPEETNSSFCDNVAPTQCADCTDDCCTYAEWSEWSLCSAACGGGSQWRQQLCNCDDTTKPCNCATGKIETQTCNLNRCCFYSENYTDPSECTKQCGSGISFTTQICLCSESEGSVPEEADVINCLHLGPPDVVVSECNNDSCCEWGEWSDWGNCTKNCNGGQSNRTRSCECPGLGDGVFPNSLCGNETDAVETSTCNNVSCCSYGNWSEWSQCTKDCGGGYQYRYQVCSCLEETNSTSSSSSKSSKSSKDWGKYKRFAQGDDNYRYDNDSDKKSYDDNDNSSKKSDDDTDKSSKKSDDDDDSKSSQPPSNSQTCYDSQTQRQQQACNTQACSKKGKSGKKYY